MTRASSLRRARRASLALVGIVVASGAASALAKEIHLDCSRPNQKVMVDADTDRRFLQLMWSDGVAEEYKDGDFYISAPDPDGSKEKVVYSMSFEHDVLYFGTDRMCLDAGARKRCAEQRLRHTLDVGQGVMKYEDVGAPILLKCAPAPRRAF